MRTMLLRTQVMLQQAKWRLEDGATAVEYGLLVGLIAVAIIGTVVLLGKTLNDVFTTSRPRSPRPAVAARRIGVAGE